MLVNTEFRLGMRLSTNKGTRTLSNSITLFVQQGLLVAMATSKSITLLSTLHMCKVNFRRKVGAVELIPLSRER